MKTIEISKRKFIASLVLSFLTGVLLSWTIRSVYLDQDEGLAVVEVCCLNLNSLPVSPEPPKTPYI